MDPCLDSRGVVDPMDGVNYQDYMKKSCKTSHLVIAEHDKWNGKRTNSNLLECLMAIYLSCNAHTASYTARLQYLLLGGWATGYTCKEYRLKDVMNTTLNAIARERSKPTRAIDYVDFPNTAQGKLVKERADNMLARDILIYHRIAYFILL